MSNKRVWSVTEVRAFHFFPPRLATELLNGHYARHLHNARILPYNNRAVPFVAKRWNNEGYRTRMIVI